MHKIPILTFHSLDQSGSVISYPPERFEKLVLFLKEQNYRTLSLNEIISWQKGQLLLTSPSIALTFDDGFESLYIHAFPLLEEAGMKATVFLTSGYCEKFNNWPSQPAGIPQLPMLKWHQIKEMACTLFDFQAHTQTHPDLTVLNRSDLRKEIISGKLVIEDRLGKRVDHFAYPYGKINELVFETTCENFETACSTELDLISMASNPYKLERVDMYYFSGKFLPATLAPPLFGPYLQLRRFLRKMRLKLAND